MKGYLGSIIKYKLWLVWVPIKNRVTCKLCMRKWVGWVYCKETEDKYRAITRNPTKRGRGPTKAILVERAKQRDDNNNVIITNLLIIYYLSSLCLFISAPLWYLGSVLGCVCHLELMSNSGKIERKDILPGHLNVLHSFIFSHPIYWIMGISAYSVVKMTNYLFRGKFIGIVVTNIIRCEIVSKSNKKYQWPNLVVFLPLCTTCT